MCPDLPRIQPEWIRTLRGRTTIHNRRSRYSWIVPLFSSQGPRQYLSVLVSPPITSARHAHHAIQLHMHDTRPLNTFCRTHLINGHDQRRTRARDLESPLLYVAFSHELCSSARKFSSIHRTDICRQMKKQLTPRDSLRTFQRRIPGLLDTHHCQ
jgi:hypothetical protein